MISFSNRQLTSWLFIASMVFIMAILQLLDIDNLRYQHNWFDQGEYWRILSAHWIHVNWRHWLLNSAGLILCMGIASPVWSIWRWVIYHLVLASGISLLFTMLNPELHWYVGYSGVLFGIFSLAAFDLYAREKLIASLLLVGMMVKIALEQTGDLNVTTRDFIDSPVIIDAHLYGLCLALVIELASRTYKMYRQTDHSRRAD